jgi:hypothetical protein
MDVSHYVCVDVTTGNSATCKTYYKHHMQKCDLHYVCVDAASDK